MLSQLIQAGVAVFCPHTAFDNAPGGINDLLAAQLSLGDVKPLRPGTGPGSCKLVVFVPEQDLDRVADALFAAGAGHIGQYSQCSFRLVGTGTFFGSELTHPTVGQKGKREEVNEWRLEVVCPEKRLGPVVAALRQAHSYEEPALDVYPLRPVLPSGGEGRIGRLPQPVSLGDLARTVKSRLKAVQALVVGDLDRMVQRVAIVCGAGGEFLGDALRSGADVLLTGEMRFHDCLTAQAEGVALLLAGHYVSERLGVEDLAVRLQDQWPDLEVWASRQERDPVTWN
jgi:dinuclear metal center YbgI/SA1388 family protein